MKRSTNWTRCERSTRILRSGSILRSESLLLPSLTVSVPSSFPVPSLTCDIPVNLINKDQVEILASLRESVSEDKAFLEVETEHLKQQIKELNEKSRMQLEQVNALLLEKVNLQSEGIGQREKMLQRERDIGFVLSSLVLCVSPRTQSRELRACLSGKDVPEDVKTRLLALHEENLNVKEQLKTTQDKLAKAKTVTPRFCQVLHSCTHSFQFIKSQDKLFKEEQTKLASMTAVCTHFPLPPPCTSDCRPQQNISEDAESSFQAQIKTLKEELSRANVRTMNDDSLHD